MFCSKCGNQLNKEDKFCNSCGSTNTQVNNNEVNNEVNQVNPIHQEFGNLNQNMNSESFQNQLNSNKSNNTKNSGIKKYLPFIIGGLIVLIIITSVVNNMDRNSDNDGNNNTSQIKGQFSREIFSGNTFEYKTMYDTASFTFNSNSTFVVSYTGGDIYTGNFEVYNGLFIAIKADEIAEDASIQNASTLATSIKNVSNSMMATPELLLNTYLLWLKTDDGVLQPFVLKYDSSTNSGTIVNVMAQTQGSFTKK